MPTLQNFDLDTAKALETQPFPVLVPVLRDTASMCGEFPSQLLVGENRDRTGDAAIVINLYPLSVSGQQALLLAVQTQEMTLIPVHITRMDRTGTVFAEYHPTFGLLSPRLPDFSTADLSNLTA